MDNNTETINNELSVVLIENYMHDRLSFSALFLGYDLHNNVYMPSNTTFHFEESKVCSILQEFSTARILTLGCLKNRG